MRIILIGNIVSFIGAMIMIAIGLIKEKKNILLAQCFQFAIMGIGNLILGGVTGFISNVISIFRNMICFKREFTWPFKVLFCILQVGISAFVNELGLIGWLPIIAAIIFTWSLDTRNEIVLKSVIIITEILWIIFDLTIHNYVTAVFDILTIVSNTAGIILILRKR